LIVKVILAIFMRPSGQPRSVLMVVLLADVWLPSMAHCRNMCEVVGHQTALIYIQMLIDVMFRFSRITAFTSLRTNLSPFTKGCREWDASM
jgi:hypothetical protein